MDYEVLDSSYAKRLKKKKSLGFLLQIDFNLADVYLLDNWSFLVMPFDPANDWLLTSDQALLRKWIKEGCFPMGDGVDRSYFERRRKLESQITFKEVLKEALCNFMFMEGKRSPADLSAEEIDWLYELLRQREMFQKFQLNFIFLLGDYIISRRKELDLHWGLLNDKQTLNPAINLIVVADQKQRGYYDIEKQLNGKQGYAGAEQYMNSAVFGSDNQAKVIVEIIRVMQDDAMPAYGVSG